MAQNLRRTRASVGFRRDYIHYQKHHQGLENLQGDVTISQISDATVESTRRMLQLANECQDAGVVTLALMNTQEEQLSRVDRNLDGTNVKINEANKDLGKLELGEDFDKQTGWRCILCYWCCKCYKCRRIDENYANPRQAPSPQITPPVNYTDNADQPRMYNGPRTKEELQEHYKSQAFVRNKKSKPKTGFIGRITNDENEDVAEQNLQEVDSVIGTLKDIAKDQGRTLSKSNIQIDSLNNKAEKSQKKLTWAQARAQRLLNQ